MNGGTSTSSSSSPPLLTVAPLVCTGTLAASTGSQSGEVTLPALPGAIAWHAPTTGLRLGPHASYPPALTLTRTSAPSQSASTVPKMMVASGCAASCTSEAASLISN